MNLSNIAQIFNATIPQVELSHQVASQWVGRELPIPLSLHDAQVVGVCLMTLQLAAIAHQPEDIAEVVELSPEDLEVLATLKPAFFRDEVPAEAVPAEVAIAA